MPEAMGTIFQARGLAHFNGASKWPCLTRLEEYSRAEPRRPALGAARSLEENQVSPEYVGGALQALARPMALPLLSIAGGQSVVHTGPPIVVTLANKVISFGCKITYPYTPGYKSFTLNYFHVDRQSQRSPEKHFYCQPSQGTENQTHTVECPITLQLPEASATGTYYCSVQWPQDTKVGNGTFILVRDSGYREPPRTFQRLLLLGFTGLLAVLSVLGTALLLWKKKQMQVQGKQPASTPKQPPSESIYTSLQHRDTQVYAFIESEASSTPSARSPLSQKEFPRANNDEELGLVYENL
ncbi:NFAT activation molecule 1 [Tenrec ecaudatus]|uniref:NFAT activation molecule 1 n=1 Tax=Tenrec ecaudatus TaxID=94439 RepID=UPI003F596619